MRPGDLILANPLTQTPKDFFGKCFATATALGRGWDINLNMFIHSMA